MGVDGFARAGVEVHALDVTVGVTVGDAVRHGQAAGLHPLEAAVVADVAFAVRADRGAVRPASGFGHHFLGPVGFDARQRAALDLGQDDAPVVHGDRAFGKFEARGDFTYCHTGLLSFDRPCCELAHIPHSPTARHVRRESVCGYPVPRSSPDPHPHPLPRGGGIETVHLVLCELHTRRSFARFDKLNGLVPEPVKGCRKGKGESLSREEEQMNSKIPSPSGRGLG